METRRGPRTAFKAPTRRRDSPLVDTPLVADEELQNLRDSFLGMYQHIDTLRKIAEGRRAEVTPDLLRGPLQPYDDFLESEFAKKELQRWKEIFAPVFAGLELFDLQLRQGAELTYRELALSNDSARLALDAIVQRLGTLQKKSAA